MARPPAAPRPAIRWSCGDSCAIGPRRGIGPGKIYWVTTCDPDGPCDQALIGAEELAQRGYRAEAPPDDVEEPEPEGLPSSALSLQGLTWGKRHGIGQAPAPDTVVTERPRKAPEPEPLPERRCSECGSAFTPSRPWQQVCSPSCSRERNRRREREAYRAAHPPKPEAPPAPRPRPIPRPIGCRSCGGPLITDPAKRRRAGRLCEPCYKAKVCAEVTAWRRRKEAAHATR